MRHDCPKCKKTYILGAGNVVLHVYRRAAWFTWAESKCPDCGEVANWFCRSCPEIFLRLQEIGAGQMVENDPDAEIVAAFREAYEIAERTTIKITQRHEQEISRLGAALETIPDALLFDLLSDPAPQPERPAYWI